MSRHPQVCGRCDGRGTIPDQTQNAAFSSNQFAGAGIASGSDSSPTRAPAINREPYYQDDAVTIYHADCLDVLPCLHGVGLVLTSPPYNLAQKECGSRRKHFRNLAGGYGTHTDDLTHGNYVAWQQDVLAACWATLADDGAIFYNHKPIARGNEVRLPLELVPAGLPLRQIVVWDRGSGFNRNPTHFVPAHEWVLLLCKPEFRLTSRSVDDVWRIAFETGGDHPAPFPIRLATQAVGATSAALVVDPFAGSGSTLVAAKSLGRRAIGIEIEERFCEIAARRCSQGVLDVAV